LLEGNWSRDQRVLIGLLPRIREQQDEIQFDFGPFTAVLSMIMTRFRCIRTVMVIMMVMVMVMFVVMVTTRVLHGMHNGFMCMVMAATKLDDNAFSQTSIDPLEGNGSQQHAGYDLRKHVEESISPFRGPVQCYFRTQAIGESGSENPVDESPQASLRVAHRMRMPLESCLPSLPSTSIQSMVVSVTVPGTSTFTRQDRSSPSARIFSTSFPERGPTQA